MNKKRCNSSSCSVSRTEEAVTKPPTLLDLPYLVRESILDLLTIKTIANFRLTSRQISNDWIEKYSKLQKRLSKIPVKFKSPKHVFEFSTIPECLPFSRFEFYFPLELSPELSLFCSKQGKFVCSLKLLKLNEFLSDFECKFLDSLESLKELHVHEFVANYNSNGFLRVPQNCLYRLESFRYDKEPFSSPVQSFLHFCPNIKKLRLGLYGTRPKQECGKEILEFIRKKNQRLKETGKLDVFEIEFYPGTKLAYYLNPQSKVTEFFQEIIQLEGKLKLSNIDTTAMAYLKPNNCQFATEEVKKILSCIKSVARISNDVISMDLPLMESLNVDLQTINSRKVIAGWRNYNESVKPEWRRLKTIKVILDNRMRMTSRHIEEDITQLVELLFGKRRPSVTEINVVTSLTDVNLMSRIAPKQLCFFYPNLKKLTLECDLFAQQDYNNLLFLLGQSTKIESLKLKIKSQIDNKFFFGDNLRCPQLLELKHLKRLVLTSTCGGFEELTDKCLSEVLSLMPLKEFRFNYEQRRSRGLLIYPPIKFPFTSFGLNTLLNNRFGETILDFQFDILSTVPFDAKEVKKSIYRIKKKSIRNREFVQPEF